MEDGEKRWVLPLPGLSRNLPRPQHPVLPWTAAHATCHTVMAQARTWSSWNFLSPALLPGQHQADQATHAAAITQDAAPEVPLQPQTSHPTGPSNAPCFFSHVRL